jgi:hypothetical protein
MKIESRAAAIPGLHLSGHGYQGMGSPPGPALKVESQLLWNFISFIFRSYLRQSPGIA